MKIIAVADTHLNQWKLPEKLLKLIRNADMLIHAGDFVSYDVYKRFSEFNLVAVRGNSDDDRIRSELKEVQRFSVGKFKF
ncbi:MAG: YfcE family phosphodiesterase, partial [Archaeoglobaceae archaeon]